MSAEGGEQPQSHKSDKPPRSKWRASESFFDLKLSHWIAILLTAALVYVGTSQLLVYRRQAKIMGTQANIATDQLSEMRAEQRPWVYADITPGKQIFWNQSGGLTFSIRFTLHNTGQSLIPLLPVRSTSCRGGAAARWRCRARTGMLHVGCADG
jgi:hypothetical protein